MISPSSAEDAAANALDKYAELLNARKSALMQILRTSTEIRTTLAREAMPDVANALARRDEESQHYAALNDSRVDDARLLDMARRSKTDKSSNLRRAADSVITLHESLQKLADDILTCQKECEALFKARLSSTSKAIRESTKRRALDAAYGPACKHEVPSFLDRQR